MFCSSHVNTCVFTYLCVLLDLQMTVSQRTSGSSTAVQSKTLQRTTSGTRSRKQERNRRKSWWQGVCPRDNQGRTIYRWDLLMRDVSIYMSLIWVSQCVFIKLWFLIIRISSLFFTFSARSYVLRCLVILILIL